MKRLSNLRSQAVRPTQQNVQAKKKKEKKKMTQDTAFLKGILL